MMNPEPQYWKHAIVAFLVILSVLSFVKFALWYGSEKTEDRVPQMNIEREIRQIYEDFPPSEELDNTEQKNEDYGDYSIYLYEIGGDFSEDNITTQDKDWNVPEEKNLTFLEEYYNNSDVEKNYWDEHLKNTIDFTLHLAKYLNSTIQNTNLTVSELSNLTLPEEYFDDPDENSTDIDKSFKKNAYKIRGYFAKIFNLTVKDRNLTIPEDYFDYSDQNNKDLDKNLKNANELRGYFAKMFNLTIPDENLTSPEGSNLAIPEDYLDYSGEKNKDLDNYLKFRKLKRRRRKVGNWISRDLKRGQRQKVRRMKH